MRITGDRMTGRLLGAQIVGARDAEVAKRIDIPAVAMFAKATVERLSDLDLSYTPPFGSPWDAVQGAGQEWSRQRDEMLRDRVAVDEEIFAEAESDGSVIGEL